MDTLFLVVFQPSVFSALHHPPPPTDVSSDDLELSNTNSRGGVTGTASPGSSISTLIAAEPDAWADAALASKGKRRYYHLQFPWTAEVGGRAHPLRTKEA